MAQKSVFVDGVGEVILQKRRGTKNLRISIGASGQVKVGMPSWVPYATGVAFAKQKKEWISLHQEKRPKHLLMPGQRIGKSHRIFHFLADGQTTVRLVKNQIQIRTNSPIETSIIQEKLTKTAEKALKKEAQELLPNRLSQLATLHRYNYEEVVIKKLTSRWGSCSVQGKITLSYYLMQLPWPLIDYVILHELAHTNHLNHSSKFWQEVSTTCSQYKTLRKEIKKYSPVVMPQSVA